MSMDKNPMGILNDICATNEFNKTHQIQTKVANVGFDWPCVNDVIGKFYEEINELKQAIINQDHNNTEEEIGDLFYTLINLARHLNVDPEKSLRLSSEKFIRRFNCLEQLAQLEKLELKSSSLDQLETLWQRAKRKESP